MQLSQAHTAYRKAVELKPGDAVFTQAGNRIAQSIVDYTQIGCTSEGGGKTTVTSTSVNPSPTAQSSDNAKVIAMVQKKVPETVILKWIRDAKDAKFDTTPDALIALSEAGVSERIVAAMQQRAGN